MLRPSPCAETSCVKSADDLVKDRATLNLKERSNPSRIFELSTRSSARMLFLDLPPELIFMVIDYVTDPLDMLDVREVCNLFNAVITQRLNKAYTTDCRRLHKHFRRLGRHTCSLCGQGQSQRDFVNHHRAQLEHEAKTLQAASHNYLRFARYILERRPSYLLSNGQNHMLDFKAWMQGVAECAEQGFTRMMRLLLEFAPRHPSEFNWAWMNRNPLHRAVLRNDVEQVEMLVDFGLPINHISRGLHVTVLWLAVTQHNPRLVTLLLARGARAHVRHPIPHLQAHPLLAACTGSGEMRGWCPHLIRILLGGLTPVTLGLTKVNQVQSLEHSSLALQVGDSPLHCIAKSGRRQCGEECAGVIDECSGRRRLHNQGEVWYILLAAGVPGDDVNRAGKTAGKTLMEVRAKRRSEVEN